MTYAFSVWAPNASSVELVRPDTRSPMARGERGWWTSDQTPAPGDLYAFSLDGGPPRPDPRSAYQPDGVHGWSRVVDHAAFRWRHAAFRAPPLASAILYELHAGTFTEAGTLDDAADKLDHLIDLGVTHVSLMPLNAFDGEHGWGYDGVAWFAPHAPYCGPDGPDAVKRFVDRCHGLGLAVILDVVYNHLGPSGNYLDEFGPYTTDAYRTPWGAAINLDDHGSDEPRRLICDSALAWLRDYRFDGLRVDAVHAFHDRSAVHLLEQLSAEVQTLAAEQARPLRVIAESDLNDPRVVTPRIAFGLGCDAQWCDDFHHAIHARFTGERGGYYADFGATADIAESLRHAYVYRGRHSGYRGRAHGRDADHLTTDRFIAYIQNHDQIGNRAAGDRLDARVPFDALRVAAAICLLGPFVPMIFQGEEWMASSPFQFFTDHRSPDLADAIREGRRGEFAAFGWEPADVPDPQDPDTFERSKLRWDERLEDEHAAMLGWYRDLIALRRHAGALSGQDMASRHAVHDPSGQWIAFRAGRLVVGAALPGEPDPRATSLPLSRCLKNSESLGPLLLASNDTADLREGTLTLHGVACAAAMTH